MRADLTKLIRLLVACLALITGCGASYSEELRHSNLIQKTEIYYDAEGRADLQAVLNEAFQPGETSQIRGYLPGAYWVRLTIDPPLTGESMEMRIEPQNRNLVTLYSPDKDSPSGWSRQTTGNSVAWSKRPLSALYLGFEIFHKVRTTYYLQVASLGAMHFQVTARDKYAVAQEDAKTTLWRGLYLLTILAIVVWSAREFFVNFRSEVAAFAVSHAGYFALALTTFGFADVVFDLDSGSKTLIFWLILLNTTAALVFHSTLAITFEVRRIFKVFFVICLAVNLAAITLNLFGLTTSALRLNSAVVLAYAVTIFISIVSSSKKTDERGYRIRVAYYAILMLSVAMHLMPALGLVAAPNFLMDFYRSSGLDGSPFVVGHLFYGFISALLFGHLLLSKSRIERKRGRETEVSLQRSEERLIAQDKRLAEQQKLTALLTHEVRNPLATIRFSLDSLDQQADQPNSKRLERIANAANSIDSLIERFVLVDELEQRTTNLRFVSLDPIKQARGLFDKFPELTAAQMKVETWLRPFESDPELLGVILTNLLDNAIKYTSDLSSVRLSVGLIEPDLIRWQIGNEVVASFKFEPHEMFQKYYRGPNVTNRPGSGLGLYVVNWIVERLGGQISVDFDDQTRRLVVNLCLPMLKQAAQK